MAMMFGFAAQRRSQLEEEFLRISAELGRLGVERFLLAGDLARDRVGRDSELEIIVVRSMEEAPARRADFFTTHLRPGVGTRIHVFTPAEYESERHSHPLLREALALNDPIDV